MRAKKHYLFISFTKSMCVYTTWKTFEQITLFTRCSHVHGLFHSRNRRLVILFSSFLFLFSFIKRNATYNDR